MQSGIKSLQIRYKPRFVTLNSLINARCNAMRPSKCVHVRTRGPNFGTHHRVNRRHFSFSPGRHSRIFLCREKTRQIWIDKLPVFQSGPVKMPPTSRCSCIPANRETHTPARYCAPRRHPKAFECGTPTPSYRSDELDIRRQLMRSLPPARQRIKKRNALDRLCHRPRQHLLFGKPLPIVRSAIPSINGPSYLRNSADARNPYNNRQSTPYRKTAARAFEIGTFWTVLPQTAQWSPQTEPCDPQ